MANVTITIAGESHEVITVIRSLAHAHGTAHTSGTPSPETEQPIEEDSAGSAPDAVSEFTWTLHAARDTRNSVSQDAQRLLDALLSAPDHQLRIDDIYDQLELDRYGLIGARRSISAALRRNSDTVNATLLTTRDRRVSLDAGYANALQSDAAPDPMSRWGPLN